MAYVDIDVVQKCLEDLSHENLIGNDNDTYISLAEASDRIFDLPTADVAEVKHGEWLNEDFPEREATQIDCAICSICKNLAPQSEHGYSILSIYCPNCGTKMKGGNAK